MINSWFSLIVKVMRKLQQQKALSKALTRSLACFVASNTLIILVIRKPTFPFKCSLLFLALSSSPSSFSQPPCSSYFHCTSPPPSCGALHNMRHFTRSQIILLSVSLFYPSSSSHEKNLQSPWDPCEDCLSTPTPTHPFLTVALLSGRWHWALECPQ